MAKRLVAKKKVSPKGISGDRHKDEVKRLTRTFMKRLERPLGLERTGNARMDRQRDDRYMMLWGLIEDLVEEAMRKKALPAAKTKPRVRGRG